jgi:hypothetical protein
MAVMDRFEKLQRTALAVWLVVLVLSLWTIGHMLFVQVQGRIVIGPVVSVSTWNPPMLTWSHYNCTIISSHRDYTAPNSLDPCQVGETLTLRVNPFNTGDVWYDGELLSGRTALAWIFVTLSLGFGVLGLLLRILGARSPW